MKLSMATVAFLALTASSGAFAAGITDPSDAAFGPHATVVDFEQAAAGTYPAYAGGLTVATAAGPVNLIGSRLQITSTYAGQYNTTGQYLSSEGYLFRNLLVTFPNPVSAFGFNVGLTNQPWQLHAYDANGGLIEMVTIPPVLGSNAGEFYGIASTTPIAQAILIVQLPVRPGPLWVVVDNLKFSGAAGAAEGADLAARAAGPSGKPRVGRKLTYRVTVANDGPAAAVAATLGATFAGLEAADAASIDAPKDCTVVGPTVTCALGDIRPGRKVKRAISVVPSAPGVVDLAATAASATPDPVPSNSTDVVTTVVP